MEAAGDARVGGKVSLEVGTRGPVADERDAGVGRERREQLAEDPEVFLGAEAADVGEDDVVVAGGADELAALGGAESMSFFFFFFF